MWGCVQCCSYKFLKKLKLKLASGQMHRVIDYTLCFEEVYSTENKYARAMVVNFVRVVIIAVWA